MLKTATLLIDVSLVSFGLVQLRGLGERCKLPSGIWGGALAEIEFGAF